MEKMKTIKRLSFLAVLCGTLLTSCYDDYVKDYDNTAAYIAYQYNLRSLVVGEGMEFKVGVVLGGVINNTKDRNIYFEMDDQLVTEDLAPFMGVDELGQPADSFNAYDALTNSGLVSQSYVSTAVAAAGIKQMTPLPTNYYSVSQTGKMVIEKGKHTASVTIKADSAAILADEHIAYKPYYAIAYKITSGQADTVILSKSFNITAIRIENMFFGNWYHGGVSRIIDDVKAEEISRNTYPTAIPGNDGTANIYSLVTDGPFSVRTNYIANKSGNMIINYRNGVLSVEGLDGGTVITDTGSAYNDAKLLQNRKLFLNYKFSNGDNTSTIVTDTLTFRNRIRDGVNEWQDEKPEHYK